MYTHKILPDAHKVFNSNILFHERFFFSTIDTTTCPIFKNVLRVFFNKKITDF